MKKKIITGLILLILIIGISLGIHSQNEKEKTSNLTKVVLTEPTLT